MGWRIPCTLAKNCNYNAHWTFKFLHTAFPVQVRKLLIYTCKIIIKTNLKIRILFCSLLLIACFFNVRWLEVHSIKGDMCHKCCNKNVNLSPWVYQWYCTKRLCSPAEVLLIGSQKLLSVIQIRKSLQYCSPVVKFIQDSLLFKGC